MLSITAALLGERLTRPGQRLLDAGCGTGGFLRWALDTGSLSYAAGVDIGSAAVELARGRVPEVDLRVASLADVPFGDATFDLVVSNDVLQHVPEAELRKSLSELRRVLAPAGVVLVRTNGARRLRQERADWRAYSRDSLATELRNAGLEPLRVTHANAVLSLWASARGRSPHAPSESRHGIPPRDRDGLRAAIGRRLLAAEARYLARPDRSIPYGHATFALARRAPGS